MCNCKNIEFGSHAANVLLPFPQHMETYRRNREAAGLNVDAIPVDVCIAPEIQQLWAAGIHTRGCCCGHNKAEPMVNVADESIDQMIAMGYQMNHADKSRRDTFRLKSIPTIKEG